MTEEEQEASIRQHGFLSPVIEQGIPFVRAANKGWFDLTYELSAYGQWIFPQAVTAVAGLSGADPKAIATQCMIRTLSNFQGVILLAERGMTVEGRTLVRSCYENTLWLGALVKQPEEAIVALEDAELNSEIGLRKVVIKIFNNQTDWPVEFRKKLELDLKYLENRPRKKSITMDALSEMAKLDSIYPIYRRLSADSAHSSIRSLNRHITPSRDSGLVEFVFGPDSEGVSEVLHLACHAFFAALTFFLDVIGSDKSDERLQNLVQAFQELTGSAQPMASTPTHS